MGTLGGKGLRGNRKLSFILVRIAYYADYKNSSGLNKKNPFMNFIKKKKNYKYFNFLV